ncbi:MAG: dihydroorotate dehydrogenase electron transfer subunit [Ignavibacteriales bacterium]|nr:dihydroorotate dehydrogenase electron transfer subunit [Ignavibacteriales bacterium]
MIIENSIIESNDKLTESIYLLKVHSPIIASKIKPGQFCNVKVSDTDYPLLRRPFSICDVENHLIVFLYQVVGVGTEILAQKMEGEVLSILGPLGNGFNFDDDFETAIIIGGGIGVAPFPFLIRNITNKKIVSYIGFRNKNEIVDYGLTNCKYATDDGSFGLKGTCIDLFKSENTILNSKTKIFACGPNPMLKSLIEYCSDKNLNCEVSLESAMACGFGICQGCVVESKEDDEYKLVCKDGPVFKFNEIKL